MRTFDIKNDPLDFEYTYNKEEKESLRDNLKKKRGKKKPDINRGDLRRVALWKINRVLEISKETIKKLNKLASMKEVSIDDPFVKDLIGDLLDSDGVDLPMASTILKFVRPDIFPIIDVRAYRALTGRRPYFRDWSLSSKYTRYVEYTKRLKEIAKKRGKLLEKIDEQLYEFDREHNGTINNRSHH